MARRTYHTSGVDIPVPPYFGEDGKEYSSYLEMVAANKAYRQQEERNQMLDEQTEAIKKQTEILERQERKQEELERKRLREEQEKLQEEILQTQHDLRVAKRDILRTFEDKESNSKKDIAKLKKKETLTNSEQKELKNLQNYNYYAKYAILVMNNIKIYSNEISAINKIMIYDEKENYKEIHEKEKKFIEKLQKAQGTIKETEYIEEKMKRNEEQFDRDISYRKIQYEKDIREAEYKVEQKITHSIIVYAFILVFSLIGIFIIPIPSIIIFVTTLILGYFILSYRSKKLKKNLEILKKQMEEEFKNNTKKIQKKKRNSEKKRAEMSQKASNLKIYGEENPDFSSPEYSLFK